MKNIVLIGMMGCGKTTIGKHLSERLDMPFFDIDTYIEDTYGSIDSLFKSGQDYFRDIEEQAVIHASLLQSHIISTGGGVVLRDANIKNLKKNGVIIFIQRPLKQIIESIETSNRPLLKNGTDILYELYEKRLPLYTSSCDYSIDASSGIENTVASILEILRMVV